MKYELSQHAADMLRRRNIRPQWLQQAMEDPQRVEKDMIDPDVVHHLRRINEFDGRVLRVLYNESVSPVRVVSVFFDRRMKGKL